jgi:hypothetical protein
MSDAAQPTGADVRAAAEAVKTAIDRHLAAIENRTGDDDPSVYAAFDALATAAEVYDELLYDFYDEVTPFDVPAGDALPAYAGPEEPDAISVLVRRDYLVADPQRLIGQVQRISESVTVDSGLNAAIAGLFGEYEPDEIASRHQEFGLEEGDSTLWVTAAEPTEPGDWLAGPFEQADSGIVICRFDVSAVFDDDADAPNEMDADSDDDLGDLAATTLDLGR